MSPAITVIVPAHNPRPDYLQAALAALDAQSLPKTEWNLLVVDNASKEPLAGRLDLRWHPAAEVLREEKLGLTHARVAGFRRATGQLLVLVDDDNVLAPDYLERALEIATAFPWLGTWSGDQGPVYEREGFHLPSRLELLVGGRRVREASWSNDVHHHASTPWGSGMCLRRRVADAYLERLAADPRRIGLDLSGGARQYGGDTDIAFVGCEIGLGKGVFPQLHLDHWISAERCSEDYLVRAAEGHAYSAIVHQFLLEGVVAQRRRGLRPQAMALVRLLTSTGLERRLELARRRGEARALREIGGLSAGARA